MRQVDAWALSVSARCVGAILRHAGIRGAVIWVAVATAQQGSSGDTDTAQFVVVREDQSDVISPSAFHWVLAAVLVVVLIFGFVRVCQLVKRTQNVTPNPPPGMVAVQCGACHAAQYVPTHGRIFICFQCHSANLVPGRPQAQLQPVPTGPLKKYNMSRLNNTFFRVDREQAENDTDGNTTDAAAQPTVFGQAQDDPENPGTVEMTNAGAPDRSMSRDIDAGMALPTCSICMDLPGNVVLLPCAHGGVCEGCARQIAQTRAVGGAQCPQCRGPIETLVKIDDIDQQAATGTELRIPIARFA